MLTPRSVGSRAWVLTLSAMTAVAALSIDMSLPAQPTLARDFGVPSSVSQLTLSVFLAGFALGQLVMGALSDALGRKRVLEAGLVAFGLAGFACSVSRSIAVLIALRFVQGAAASAAPVVARAMVRDTQPASEAARLLSAMVAVLAIAPMVAPLLGGALLTWFGWRAIFVALGVCGALLFTLGLTLPETLPHERRPALSLRNVLRGFVRFLATPGTRVPTALVCLGFAGQFAYISDSPFVLIEGYGVRADRYALYFAATALALMIAAAVGSRVLRAGRSPRHLLAAGVSLIWLGGLILAAVVHAGLGKYAFMAPMLVYFVGIGLLGPSATALAMDPVPGLAGTASAVIGFLQMTSGALSGWLTTAAGGSDPRPLGVVLAGVGTAAALLAFFTRGVKTS